MAGAGDFRRPIPYGNWLRTYRDCSITWASSQPPCSVTPRGAIAQQLALDYPGQCDRLVLGCTYAYNLGSPSEWIEGHLAPWLVRLLGPKRLGALGAKLGVREMDRQRVESLVKLMADQDRLPLSRPERKPRVWRLKTALRAKVDEQDGAWPAAWACWAGFTRPDATPYDGHRPSWVIPGESGASAKIA